MSKLFGLPLLLGLVAFLIGWLVAKFAAYVGSRAAGLNAPETDRAIRALEANLRVARKDAEEATEKFMASTQQLDTLRASLNDLEQTMQFREEEMETMREAVKHESAKVVELRRTLTQRAEETIRATASARESETELSLLKVSDSDLFDEADLLDAGREKASQRALKSGTPVAKKSATDSIAEEDPLADQYVPDC